MRHQRLFIAIIGMRAVLVLCTIASALYFAKPIDPYYHSQQIKRRVVFGKNNCEYCKAEILRTSNIG